MKYLIALLIAAFLIGGGYAYCVGTRQILEATLRDAIATNESLTPLEKERLLGQVDSDTPVELGLEIPPELMTRITLTQLLRQFWYVWVLLICGLCLGGAWLWPSKSPELQNESQSTPD